MNKNINSRKCYYFFFFFSGKNNEIKVSFESSKKLPNSLELLLLLRDIWLRESSEITRHQFDHHFQESNSYEGVTDM